MQLYKFFSLISFVCLLSSCTNNNKIVSTEDYEKYLIEGSLSARKEQIANEKIFWEQKLATDPGSYVYMLKLASACLQSFKVSGNANDLSLADELLKTSAAKLNNRDADILFAVSQTSITQHKFKQADQYNQMAAATDVDAYTLRLLEFDTKMELGQYEEAWKKLQLFKQNTSFDYLIRYAKYQDHQGDLDGAIITMEEAFDKVRNKNKSLYCWALSNLADMYGHAGKVQEAYNAYLNVLQKDPAYLYALKGIAWIAYSHDKNTQGAKRILNYMLSESNTPDLLLTLAEIAEWEGDSNRKDAYIKQFVNEVTKPAYGDMYNKYLITIYADDKNEIEKALMLAEKEVKNRPTPETYNWLAWVKFKQGKTKEAYKIASDKVYRRSFEPDALYTTAIIFAANGKKTEAKEMLNECAESSFEIGPVSSKQVKEELMNL